MSFEGPAPRSVEAGRGDREENKRGRSEAAGGSGSVGEVRQMWRGEVMNGFKGVEEELKVYSLVCPPLV